MLDVLRKRKRSWIIVFLVGIIVVVFALWGVGSYTNDPGPAYLAIVNGEAVQPREFEIRYQRLLENYRNLFRGALSEEMLQNLNLRATVLEDLIHRRLLLQEARRLKLLVNDEELREEIARVPVFQVDGRFSKNRYLQTLRSNRIGAAEFETEQREQLMIQKLYGLVRDSAQVTEAEIRARYRWLNEKLNLQVVRINAAPLLNQVEVTAQEIKDHYERNRESFREPLRVQIEYVTYPFEQFAAKAQVSEKEIAEYYAMHRESRFRQAGAVRLRHILFRIPDGADAERKEQIRLKANGVRDEALAGRDFAQLAKTQSEDASAEQGGEIGWFSQGQLLPALDNVAFSLKKGEVSPVVESPFGYHLLKVEETREERTRSLKEARREIVRTLKAEKAKSGAGRAVDADRAETLSGAELSALAKERGLPYRVSPWFSRVEPVPEIGSVDAFNKVAVGLAPKELSAAVEGPGAYYLMRGRGRRESAIPPLEEVRGRIEKKLKEGKAFDLAVERAKSLLGQLQKEKDLQALARRQGTRVEETGWFSRGAAEIPKIGALREVGPATLEVSRYQPIPDRVYTQGMTAYVIALKDSQEADPARFEKERERLREELLAEKRQRALERFLESLKAKAKIEIRPEYLERG